MPGSDEVQRRIGGPVAVGIEHADEATARGERVRGDDVAVAHHVRIAPGDDPVEEVRERGQLLVGEVTNPVDFATFDSLTVPADSSADAPTPPGPGGGPGGSSHPGHPEGRVLGGGTGRQRVRRRTRLTYSSDISTVKPAPTARAVWYAGSHTMIPRVNRMNAIAKNCP